MQLGSALGQAAGMAANWIQQGRAANVSRDAIKENREAHEAQMNEYSQEMNKDSIGGAQAQAMLGQQQSALKEQNKQNAATNAIMGGVAANNTANAQAAAQTIGNTTSQLLQNAEQRRNDLWGQTQQLTTDFNQQQLQQKLDRAQQMRQSGENMQKSFAELGKSLSSSGISGVL